MRLVESDLVYFIFFITKIKYNHLPLKDEINEVKIFICSGVNLLAAVISASKSSDGSTFCVQKKSDMLTSSVSHIFCNVSIEGLLIPFSIFEIRDGSIPED